jgi:hypothetical protein
VAFVTAAERFSATAGDGAAPSKRENRVPKKPTSAPATSAPSIILHENLPIIEVAETWLLDVVLADASAAHYIVTRLSDRVALVAPGQIDALLARLRKLGHTPRVLEK